MNRVALWMMRLYPARWRRRYGGELAALIEDAGADVRVVADLMRGGVWMQFSTWSFAKLAVVLGVAGLVLGAAGSFLIAPVYRSTATLKIDSAVGGSEREELARIQGMVTSRTELSSVINDPRLLLYMDKLKVEPLEDVIEGMKRDIRIDVVQPPGVFEISFLYTDPVKAQNAVNVLTERLGLISESIRQTQAAAGRNGIDVLDNASLPMRPLFPSSGLVAWVGLLCGLGVAISWRRYRGKRFATWGFAGIAFVLGLAGVIGSQAAFIIGVYGYQSDDEPNVIGVKFRSSATMSVQGLTPQQVEGITREVLSQASFEGLILEPRLQLKEAAQKLRENVTVDYDSAGRYLTISFAYTDRFKAQQTVSMLMKRFDEVGKRMLGDVPASAAARDWGTISVLNPASQPILPVSPNRFSLAAEGGISGLALAAFIALVRRRWKPEPELPLDPVSE